MLSNIFGIFNIYAYLDPVDDDLIGDWTIFWMIEEKHVPGIYPAL